MKKTIGFVILLLTLSVSASAQNTTVSATVTDVGAQAWVNGTVTFQFVPGPGGATRAPILVALDGSGAFSHAIPSNALISPANSKYIVTVCPKANPAPCFATAPLTISGSSQSLTSTLVPPAVTVNASVNNQPSAYSDAEIAGPTIGFTYYNIIGATVRVYDGSAFADVGGGGGGGLTAPWSQTGAELTCFDDDTCGTQMLNADESSTTVVQPGIVDTSMNSGDTDCLMEGTDVTCAIAAGDTSEMTAQHVSITTDSGGITVGGLIDPTTDCGMSASGINCENASNVVGVGPTEIGLGTAHISDSTNANGTAGQVLVALGSNHGVLWVTKDDTGAIVASSLAGGAPGAGYAVGDTGTFDGGNNDATYIIDTVDGSGLVLTYTIDAPGTGYTVGEVGSTPGGGQPGAGSGFGIQILAVN